MLSFLSIVLVAGLVSIVFGATIKVPVTKLSGLERAGSYIITLKSVAARTLYERQLKNPGHIYNSVFSGFSAILSPEELEIIQADPNVASIEEDGTMYTLATVTQTDAPWGLGRISQNPKLSSTDTSSLTYQYRYESAGIGSGVDVYVIDTGIYTAHAQFGGRAVWGATFGGYANVDGQGHGTHCAGLIGSTQFGVAKSVRLIAVKVLSDSGSGALSDVIARLNWIKQAQATGRPSVVSMSIGGSTSSSVDNAVNSLALAGIPVVVAAGGSAADVSGFSPARVPSAITVAASDILDRFASFSNTGAGVDIIAPGVNIISTWIGSPTATATLSGTSMPGAYVAGLIAYFASESGSAATGQQLLIQNGVPNVLTGVPAGTINLLANNEF